jgi:hypothetical protein
MPMGTLWSICSIVTGVIALVIIKKKKNMQKENI